MMPVARATERRVIELSVKNECKMVQKVALVVSFGVLSVYMSGMTQKNYKTSVKLTGL
jgi:hypothetical protein